jgi:predicted NodU family carbamoyl transferase
MPSILGLNSSHDGAVALIEDERLAFCIEAEKNSNERHSRLSLSQFIDIVERIPDVPDVIAIGGWSNYFGGYSGLDCPQIRRANLFGADVGVFSSSHERSHLIGTYAMSPFEQGRPCYCLLWEGTIGCFYKIDAKLRVHRIKDVMSHPGWRFPYLYYLGLENSETAGFWGRMEMAGKLMALAGVASPKPLTDLDSDLISWILDPHKPIERDSSVPSYLPSDKRMVAGSSEIVNAGVDNDRFRNLAWHFSRTLFDMFFLAAKEHLTEKIPLLISGGCGLNCDWNTRWKNSELFSDVFVAPCANDSGSAIGTAVDAQFALTGRAKVKWNVYSGSDFVDDCGLLEDWTERPLDFTVVSSLLKLGSLIPWVQGPCEIGPRALGNRSILAEPFNKSTTTELNRLKMRESYRPIAPICLEEDVSLHFDWSGPSPYMLYFQKVKDLSLGAIIHSDGTARVQTVNASQNQRMYRLLVAFKQLTGRGVLCNTSLNFKHRGFINRKSDLMRFARGNALKCVVVGDSMFQRTDS